MHRLVKVHTTEFITTGTLPAAADCNNIVLPRTSCCMHHSTLVFTNMMQLYACSVYQKGRLSLPERCIVICTQVKHPACCCCCMLLHAAACCMPQLAVCAARI
jgi:hypothetical protein